MKQKINSIIIFYVLYFSWLFLVAYLWPNSAVLTFFLLLIVGFYFIFLKEKSDLFLFAFVTTASWFISKELALDPGFTNIGFPPLGIPYWPIAWGVTALSLRKLYLLLSTDPDS